MPDLCQAQYLVNNISEGIHRIKCNFEHNDKKSLKHMELNISIATVLNISIALSTINTYKLSNQHNIRLFYCCKKVFIFMNIWTIKKKLMKHHYL